MIRKSASRMCCTFNFFRSLSLSLENLILIQIKTICSISFQWQNLLLSHYLFSFANSYQTLFVSVWYGNFSCPWNHRFSINYLKKVFLQQTICVMEWEWAIDSATKVSKESEKKHPTRKKERKVNVKIQVCIFYRKVLSLTARFLSMHL